MQPRAYWPVLLIGLSSLFLVVGCDGDDDNIGETKLVVNTLDEYESADLWVIINDPMTDSVLQVNHFTEPGVHEIPGVPDLFALTLVQDWYGMVRFSTFPRVKRQLWNLSPVTYYAFPDGEVMVQVELPDDSIERVTATLPGSFSEAQIFEFEGATWAYTSLGYLTPQSGSLDLLVIGRGQDQCYANWLLDQVFSGEYDFRSISLNRPARKQTLSFSSPISLFYALGHNPENGRWPYIFEEIEDTTQFSQCELVIPDFPVEEHWLSVETDGDVRMSYTERITELPEVLNIPQKSATFGIVDSVQANDVAVNGIADAVAVSWSASSFEHSVLWTVYAPNSSVSITRPALPDSVIQSVGVWADFEPLRLMVYDFEPATSWDQFVRYVARGTTVLENGLNSAYQLTYRLNDHTADLSQPGIRDLVADQLAIAP